MGCSFPIILSAAGSTTFTVLLRALGHYFDPLLERNGEPVRGKGFCVDDFTNEAMSFIERSVQKNKPFFAYVPTIPA